MSNLERDPAELVADAGPAAVGPVDVQVLTAREVPLGGPRAMPVHRTLPQRGRPTIGAWCFADHYGLDGTPQQAMVVPPHPHTGLQTASWLFEGEIEHRDSVGTRDLVHPGQLNLMTAGRAIAHSEVSTAASARLHGVQLWIVLPDSARFTEPFFEQANAVPVSVGDARLQVFAGEFAGARTYVSLYTPLVGAQVDLPPYGSADLPLDPSYEYGFLVDRGPLRVDATELAVTELGYLSTDRTSVRIAAGENGARALLLGGVPFTERFIMWWNFIGRSHDEIVQFRSEWQGDVITAGDPGGPFGWVDYDGAALPAPEMPTVRLKPRE
ncbi:pirin family protein [Rathayibacter sp. YIM 133350]|uniref:pirin family protein n=1 Tax=Rathayibacter sp. YIM 133350 TaxID=3131992 RepID=UPI00307D072C